MSADELEYLFPRLKVGGYQITSPQADRPNCIGWALYSTNLYFDPLGAGGQVGGYYWPDGVRADYSVEAWRDVFALHRYEVCEDAEIEPGMEKIVIYAGSDGEASHVARQLPSGEWTSKIGQLEDIRHATLDALMREPEYVVIAVIMRRPRR